MAIDSYHWDVIRSSNATGKALSAGYPDMLLELPDILKGVGSNIDISIAPRPGCEEVAKHHSWSHPMYRAHDVFKLIGLRLDVIDREVRDGCERVADLNVPQELGEYDLVVDPGTLEHCFNIAQAAANLAGAVKEGGYITHAIPMSMFNHGYYNVNPVWFWDFYEANGFELERIFIRHQEGIFQNPKRTRLKGVPDGAVTVMLARRVNKRPIVWPQQLNPEPK